MSFGNFADFEKALTTGKLDLPAEGQLGEGLAYRQPIQTPDPEITGATAADALSQVIQAQPAKLAPAPAPTPQPVQPPVAAPMQMPAPTVVTVTAPSQHIQPQPQPQPQPVAQPAPVAPPVQTPVAVPAQPAPTQPAKPQVAQPVSATPQQPVYQPMVSPLPPAPVKGTKSEPENVPHTSVETTAVAATPKAGPREWLRVLIDPETYWPELCATKINDTYSHDRKEALRLVSRLTETLEELRAIGVEVRVADD